VDKLSDLLHEATGERLPWIFKFMLKYVMVVLVFISFIVGVYVELTTNPLKLPTWAKVFGLIMMFTPITISLIGLCVPKEKFMCCLAKHLAPLEKKVTKKEEIEGQGEEVKEAELEIELQNKI
jgi:hypothetical protein